MYGVCAPQMSSKRSFTFSYLLFDAFAMWVPWLCDWSCSSKNSASHCLLFIVPFVISRKVEALLAWAFASYESSHLRWNIHTLPQASSHILRELYIIVTFALRARTSELHFSIKRKGEGPRVGATTINWWSLRPHLKGLWKDSASHICNHWRWSHSITPFTFHWAGHTTGSHSDLSWLLLSNSGIFHCHNSAKSEAPSRYSADCKWRPG